MQKTAGIAVHQHRIRRRHYTVAHHRITALFKIQVSADMVHNDEVLPDPGLQMRDRFVQTHAVKT